MSICQMFVSIMYAYIRCSGLQDKEAHKKEYRLMVNSEASNFSFSVQVGVLLLVLTYFACFALT